MRLTPKTVPAHLVATGLVVGLAITAPLSLGTPSATAVAPAATASTCRPTEPVAQIQADGGASSWDQSVVQQLEAAVGSVDLASTDVTTRARVRVTNARGAVTVASWGRARVEVAGSVTVTVTADACRDGVSQPVTLTQTVPWNGTGHAAVAMSSCMLSEGARPSGFHLSAADRAREKRAIRRFAIGQAREDARLRAIVHAFNQTHAAALAQSTTRPANQVFEQSP